MKKTVKHKTPQQNKIYVFFQNTYVQLGSLVILSLATFWPVLKMYFYADDYGQLYELTEGSLVHNWSSLSPHIFRYFLEVLYKMFGLNAAGYYAVGLGMFALSTVVVYLFFSKLLGDKTIACIAGLIYATTPIGVGTVFMMTTFFVESGYPITIMLLILLFCLYMYFTKKKIFFYVLTNILLLVFLIYNPRRGFLFIPTLILFDYCFHFKNLIPRWTMLLRLLVFVGMLYVAYTLFPAVMAHLSHDNTYSALNGGGKLLTLFQSLFAIEPYVSLANVMSGGLLLLFTGGMITDFATIQHTHFWVGVILLIVVSLTVMTWRTNKTRGIWAVFGLGWVYTSILGFYVFSSPGISELTARSVTFAGPGYALFVALSGFSLYQYLRNKYSQHGLGIQKTSYVVLGLFLAINFFVTRSYLENFNTTRSNYARTFFLDIKKIRPIIPKNSLVYIQASDSPEIRSRLYNIVKGNVYGVNGTIGIFYGYTYDLLYYADDYATVQQFVEKDPAKIDTVYTFHYSQNGLSDATDRMRKKLQKELLQ